MARSSSTTNMVDDVAPFQTEGQLLHAVWRGRARLGKEALGKARQLLCPDRLVQMHTAVAGDLAQAIGRDVACQDNGRDCVLSLLLQPGDDLEPVEALRQVVVGDDQVRHGRPLGCQLQRLVPICGDDSAMTLVVKKQLQHFEHSRIVFDDQDRAAGGCALLRLVLARNRQVRQLRLAQAVPRW